MPTLTPAYGRDYRSAKAVTDDFLAGKDFILHDLQSRWDGKPCSIRDLTPGTQVELRYAKLRRVTLVTVPGQ